MKGAEYALAIAMIAMLAAPGVGRGEESNYDEFGRRPAVPESDLSLPDPMLDSRWPPPAPGEATAKPETLDSDEERLDPLHEDQADDDTAVPGAARRAPAQPEELPASVEELLRRGPAGEGVVVPAPLPPAQYPDEDQDRSAPGSADPAED
ncbi:MAG: hypothetical protein HY899_18215 [Deltaproteobacteria bacterium]|nr:hypothetical protein [Deltaproteobacteria bacterium]